MSQKDLRDRNRAAIESHHFHFVAPDAIAHGCRKTLGGDDVSRRVREKVSDCVPGDVGLLAQAEHSATAAVDVEQPTLRIADAYEIWGGLMDRGKSGPAFSAPLTLSAQRLFTGLALDGIAQGSQKSARLDLAFDEIILRAFLQRL